MHNYSWGPSCKLNLIKERAKLLKQIREFFSNKKITEVDTPLLCQYSATAVHIDPIVVAGSKDPEKLRFLQTSPEYAMKRLLAAGSGDLFQICKAFRNHEIGKLHNPEFTILEWYRVGFDHHKLMQEIVELLSYVLSDNHIDYKINKISYREVFFKYLKVDPINLDLDELKQAVQQHVNLSTGFVNFLSNATKQDCQEILFSNCIEPYFIGENQIWFVYDYPKEQAALAKIEIDNYGDPVGQRFELYINGLELANGYNELLDPKIQYQRFLEDQKLRSQLGKGSLAIDPYLIQALEFGLPECSGVALGIDRLLMVKAKVSSIEEVLCFPWKLA